MAPSLPVLRTTQVTGIAEPHQSTVTTILRAVQLGLFTEAQAQLLIDRVRAHVTPLPRSGGFSAPRDGSGSDTRS